MIPEWTNKYIGIPYTTHDCWCLYQKIFYEQTGAILQHGEYSSPDNMVDAEANFHTLAVDWIKLEKPEELCLIMINIAGHPVHVGMCLDNQFMIHTLKGHNSVIDRYTSSRWKNRIQGYYKWPSI